MVQFSSVVMFALIPLLVAASPIAQPVPPKGAAPVNTSKTPSSKANKAPSAKGPVSPNAQAILSSLRRMKKGEFKPLSRGGAAAKGVGKSAKAPALQKSAVPKHAKGLPKGTHMLAVDEATGQVHAFSKDKKKLGGAGSGKAGTGKSITGGANKKTTVGGDEEAPVSGATTKAPVSAKRMMKEKRDGSSQSTSGCQPLSTDDLKKLPGWAKLEAEAKKQWGGGSYNLVTNDKDYPDRPATVCADTETVRIKQDAKPSCQANEIKVNGTLSSGQVTLQQTYGTEYSNSMTVTKESSIMAGVSMSVGVSIPDLVDVHSEVTFQSTFTNSLSKQTSSTASTQVNIGIAQNVNGTGCLWLKTSDCQITGTGSARFIASGFAWFEYNDKTHDHYKWALHLDEVLTPDERSSFMDFKSAISGKTTGQYTDKC